MAMRGVQRGAEVATCGKISDPDAYPEKQRR